MGAFISPISKCVYILWSCDSRSAGAQFILVSGNPHLSHWGLEQISPCNLTDVCEVLKILWKGQRNIQVLLPGLIFPSSHLFLAGTVLCQLCCRYSSSLSFQELILRVCFHILTLFSLTKLIWCSSPPPLCAFYQVVVPGVQCSEMGRWEMGQCSGGISTTNFRIKKSNLLHWFC